MFAGIGLASVIVVLSDSLGPNWTVYLIGSLVFTAACFVFTPLAYAYVEIGQSGRRFVVAASVVVVASLVPAVLLYWSRNYLGFLILDGIGAVALTTPMFVVVRRSLRQLGPRNERQPLTKQPP